MINPRTIIRDKIINKLLNDGKFVVTFKDQERREILDLVRKVKEEKTMHLSFSEGCQIAICVIAVSKLKGDVVEVGVFKGGSAKVICETKGDKILHLFDTFEGLPETSEFDNRKYHRTKYNQPLLTVGVYLRKYDNIKFYKGMFPGTAKAIKSKRFSFVHLDLDIYQSTLDGLKFFYDKMNKGGIIITHDYTLALGVKKAFDEFFENKDEPIITINNSQGMVVKI